MSDLPNDPNWLRESYASRFFDYFAEADKDKNEILSESEYREHFPEKRMISPIFVDKDIFTETDLNGDKKISLLEFMMHANNGKRLKRSDFHGHDEQWDQLFKKYDIDNDGVITRYEVDKLNENEDNIDTEGATKTGHSLSEKAIILIVVTAVISCSLLGLLIGFLFHCFKDKKKLEQKKNEKQQQNNQKEVNNKYELKNLKNTNNKQAIQKN